jgi:hypothetical protein
VVALAGGAQAAPMTPNLVQDGGAERGGVGWHPENGFGVGRYGDPGRPSTAIGDSIDGGAVFFTGGTAASRSMIRQVIDVRPAATQIDGGGVTATLSGLLGGLDDQGDTVWVTAEFLPENQQGLLGSEVKIGPVRVQERGGQTAFVPRSSVGQVPGYTRWILLTITAERASDDTSTDAYADNVTLVLKGASFTPAFITTQPSAVSAKAKRRRVSGRVSAAAPCAAGRSVVVTKGSKVLARTRTGAGGGFRVKTKKHAKGKLTVTVPRKDVDDTICTAASTTVPGRH